MTQIQQYRLGPQKSQQHDIYISQKDKERICLFTAVQGRWHSQIKIQTAYGAANTRWTSCTKSKKLTMKIRQKENVQACMEVHTLRAGIDYLISSARENLKYNPSSNLGQVQIARKKEYY